MAVGQRRLAAPSLLRICGASLPVGGPVNVCSIAKLIGYRLSLTIREPCTSFQRVHDFFSYNTDQFFGGFACHVTIVQELSENQSLPRW